MKSLDGVYWNSNSKTILRRRRVIDRLEAQLAKGIKDTAPYVLTPTDIERINKELTTLKSRIF